MSHFSSGTIQRVGEVYDTLDTGESTSVTGNEIIALSTETYQIAQVCVQADADNSTHVYIGSPTRCVFKLEPGASLTIPIDSLAKVVVKFNAVGDRIMWIAARDA